MLRISLIGCGKAADQHVSEIKRLKNVQIVAVCDTEPLMAERLTQRYDIPRHFSSVDRMLEEVRPDVVHITTPPTSHLCLAMKALQTGCHIFVEKPLTLNSKQAEELIQGALRSGRKMTIGYTHYFDPVVRLMRRILKREALGKIAHVETSLGYDLSGQFGEPICSDDRHWVRGLPGRLFHNVIDHLLNKVTEFVTDENPTIYAYRGSRGEAFGSDTDLLEEVRVMINGKETSAYLTFSALVRPAVHCLTVRGTKGTVHVDFVTGTMIFESASIAPGAFGRLLCSFDQARQHFQQGGRNLVKLVTGRYNYLDGFNFLLNAFYNSIIYDTPVPIPYTEILRVSCITDTIFECLAQDQHYLSIQ